MSYDDGRFYTRQSVQISADPVANNDAAAVLGRHKFFTAVKLLECRAYPTTAGKADTSAIGVYNGTTSIGSIAVGTGAAGTWVNASLTDTDFAADGELIFKSVAATETGVWEVAVDYQERFTG